MADLAILKGVNLCDAVADEHGVTHAFSVGVGFEWYRCMCGADWMRKPDFDEHMAQAIASSRSEARP